LYVGFFPLPPVYPDVTETTPGSLSNGASMHQKQPPANVAFSNFPAAVSVVFFTGSFPATTAVAAKNDNNIVIMDPFRMDMVFPPSFSNPL
jgi:hypothetical protein